MPSVEVPDASLYYQIDDFSDPWRSGSPVLLHHAAIGNTERWRPWVPTLARDHPVIRMDARGHGRSSIPPEGYAWSIERLAADVAEVITAAGRGPVHYVGASAGGEIGLQVAVQHPDLLRSLTLVASTPKMTRTNVDFAEWLARIERLGVGGFLRSDAASRFSPSVDSRLVDWFVEVSEGTPASTVTGFVPYMASVDLVARLPEIEVPVLLLAASDDQITPLEVQRDMVKDLRNAELVVYETTGHNIAEELADRCAQDTLRHISKH